MSAEFHHIAPCGLDCSRCSEYKGGPIGETSAHLLDLLGNYGRLAGLKAELNPLFKEYASFHALLSFLASPSCGGCRQPDAHCPVNCQVRTCLPEHQVDFCFQCAEYPCATGAEGFIGLRWRANNDHMQEQGLEAYDKEQKLKPRYP